MAQSKLVKALDIAEEVSSDGRSANVCEEQCHLLVRAFVEVHRFLEKCRSESLSSEAAMELGTHAVWDLLIGSLCRGRELLNSYKTDDWIVRSLLSHESHEDFLDVHAELFGCVEVLTVWLLKQLDTLDGQQRSVVREEWSSFSRMKTDYKNLEDAARIDRNQLPEKAREWGDRKRNSNLNFFIRFLKPDSNDNHEAQLQVLFDVLSDNKEPSAIDHRQIKRQKKIAKGSYGAVYNAEWLGQAFAVKVFLPGDTSFTRELAVLVGHKHPNILRIAGHSYDERKRGYSLVMEKMDMDLAAFLKKKGEVLPLAVSLDILLQISKAMAWLHSKKVIHRDLKPQNILLKQSESGEQLTVRVSDFGLARTNFSTYSATMRRGTIFYMAPEVWDSENYSKKADVYSFAMLSYQVLTGLLPFKDICGEPDFMKRAIKGERPEFPESVPKVVKTLVKSCWEPNAEQRPDFKTIRDTLITLKADTLIGNSLGGTQAALPFNDRADVNSVDGAGANLIFNEDVRRQPRSTSMRLTRHKVRPFSVGTQHNPDNEALSYSAN